MNVNDDKTEKPLMGEPKDKRRHAARQQHSDAWLARSTTIRKLWWVFAGALVLSVVVQGVFKVKGYFGVDGWFGFGALFGFLSCLAMVLFAKMLGRVLKRGEDYYREPEDE